MFSGFHESIRQLRSRYHQNLRQNPTSILIKAFERALLYIKAASCLHAFVNRIRLYITLEDMLDKTTICIMVSCKRFLAL